MIRVQTAGIEAFERVLTRFEPTARKAAALAINDIARRERTIAKRLMQSQVNVPPSTFEGKKFFVSKFANPGDLEATVTAERRPLNLVRFITSRTLKGEKGRRGLEVQVKQGGSKRVLAGSFLIPTPGNTGFGLAIRTKGPLRKSRKARKIGKNLYILFGPSVNQLYGNISPERVKPASAALEVEFLRQFERLQRDG